MAPYLQDTFVRAKKWVQELKKQGDIMNLLTSVVFFAHFFLNSVISRCEIHKISLYLDLVA